MPDCRHFSSFVSVDNRGVTGITGENGTWRLATGVENLVETNTTYWDLHWVREHHEDCDRQLSGSDGDRIGRVHRNDVGPDLPRCERYGRN